VASAGEVREFLRKHTQRWSVRRRGDSHLILLHVETGARVSLAATPSCPRWRANTEAAMRRNVRLARLGLDANARPFRGYPSR